MTQATSSYLNRPLRTQAQARASRANHANRASQPVISKEFTYARARMIVYNAAAYDASIVKRAALWMIGYLPASSEDIANACACL